MHSLISSIMTSLLLFCTLFSLACTKQNIIPIVKLSFKNEVESNNMENAYSRITEENTVSSIINHKAFKNFGKLLLPVRNASDINIHINNISSLLPYHSNIKTDTTVNVINYMINEVEKGRTIFFDFYTDTQKKQDTGLFFFRGEPNAPFVIICPGGGFSYVGSIHEGFPYAIELAKRGYNAFVLSYRVGSEQRATEDLALAISYIFKNVKTLEVDTKYYSIWGSSAGARMAANIGTEGVSTYGGDNLPKPAAVIMLYTGRTTYSKNDPPTFAIVGENDNIARPTVMESRINALKSVGVDTEFHIYKNLGHGFGLGMNTSADGWVLDAISFWKKILVNKLFLRG